MHLLSLYYSSTYYFSVLKIRNSTGWNLYWDLWGRGGDGGSFAPGRPGYMLLQLLPQNPFLKLLNSMSFYLTCQVDTSGKGGGGDLWAWDTRSWSMWARATIPLLWASDMWASATAPSTRRVADQVDHSEWAVRKYWELGARYPCVENMVWSDQEDHEERWSKGRAANARGPHSDSFHDESRRRGSSSYKNNF